MLPGRNSARCRNLGKLGVGGYRKRKIEVIKNKYRNLCNHMKYRNIITGGKKKKNCFLQPLDIYPFWLSFTNWFQALSG